MNDPVWLPALDARPRPGHVTARPGALSPVLVYWGDDPAPVVPQRRSSRPAGGFLRCDDRAGMGFRRQGAFGLDRTFPRCTRCDGTGQLYLPNDP